jgi:hypothetical protein
MASIHHSIVKAAAAKGYILTLEDDTIECTHPQTNARVYENAEGVEGTDLNELAKQAWALCGELVGFMEDDANDGVFVTQIGVGEEFQAQSKGEVIADGDSFEALLEAIEGHRASNDEGTEEAGEEEPDSRDVVPAKYKALYREIGVRGQDNGDWLAEKMAKYCVVVIDGKDVTSVDSVQMLAQANAVQYAFPEETRGWQGRYRMTASNMLRKAVADKEVLVIPAQLNGGEEVSFTPPAEFCAKFKTKPRIRKSKKAAATEA